MLSPSQILERLDDRFNLLTGGRRRTRGRQQTLEATIAWSYDLLDAPEQDALRRISVMPAAFDLELAAAVMDRTTTATLDLLGSLTSRSLLQTTRDDRSPELRYRLLETIRAYAHDRLVDHGDAEATRDRHARHVVVRLASPWPMWLSMRPEHRLLADAALGAIDWARAGGDALLGAQLACVTPTIFIARGLFAQGIATYEWAATADDAELRSHVWAAGSLVGMAAGTDVLMRFANRSLRAAGDLPVPWRAGVHGNRLVALMFADDVSFAEELRLGREAGLLPGAGPTGLDLCEADWLLWHGDHRAAIDIAETARWFSHLDPLLSMNLHGAHLLAQLLAGDRSAVAEHLAEPSIATLRDGWMESVLAASTGWSATGQPRRGRRVPRRPCPSPSRRRHTGRAARHRSDALRRRRPPRGARLDLPRGR